MKKRALEMARVALAVLLSTMMVVSMLPAPGLAEALEDATTIEEAEPKETATSKEEATSEGATQIEEATPEEKTEVEGAPAPEGEAAQNDPPSPPHLRSRLSRPSMACALP